MNGKKTFHPAAAYIVGLLTLAFGTALMERANFGMSMVVAPAYLLHLKISQTLPFFTFGMAEYCLQAVLLISIVIIRKRFKLAYLLSFATAILYGFTLDLIMMLVAPVPMIGIVGRVAFFAVGMIFCSLGVSMFFHTYYAPEAYEFMVKEIAEQYNKNINRVKTVYDCTSCLVAIILSFAFFGFGHFEGVKVGTVICALVNGWLIGRISAILEKHFQFKNEP